jgi:hypothetical protein
MFSESIERKRRSVSKPRVAPGGATLGYTIPNLINPNGVVSRSGQNPVGVLGNFWRVTQGSRSFLAATLGWRTERRWRSLVTRFWMRGRLKKVVANLREIDISL